jgi:mono/diheme cytochrome c family protein
MKRSGRAICAGILCATLGLIPLLHGQTKKEAPPAQAAAVQLYAEHCAQCHGEDGRGAVKMPDLPDLSNANFQKMWTDEGWARVLLKGNHLMPDFERVLEPDQVTQLVRFVRTLVQPPAPAGGKPKAAAKANQ